VTDGKLESPRLPIVWSLARLDSGDWAMDRKPLVIGDQYLVALRWSRDVAAFVPFVWNSSTPHFATFQEAQARCKILRTMLYPDGEPGCLTQLDDLPKLKAEMTKQVEELGAAFRAFMTAKHDHLADWFRFGPGNSRREAGFYPWHALPKQGTAILYAVLTSKQPDRLPSTDAMRVLRYSPNMVWEDLGITFEKSRLFNEKIPPRTLEPGLVIRMAMADGLECGHIIEWHQTITTEVGDFDVQVVFSAESSPPGLVSLGRYEITVDGQAWDH
jgi:hypothetical protein